MTHYLRNIKLFSLLAVILIPITACSAAGGPAEPPVLTTAMAETLAAAPRGTSAASVPPHPIATPNLTAKGTANASTATPTWSAVATATQEAAAQPTLAYPVPGQTSEPTTSAYPAAPTNIASPALALPTITAPFDQQLAFKALEYQMSLGPRTPGSPAHTQVIEWMKTELAKNGWTVETQDTTEKGQPVHNVIAKRGTGAPWTIIGAHFDSRMKASQDPDPAKRNDPVPAANDGASGVAVLMELSRVLPKDLKGQVWLAFFDSEDQGEINGWDWILGSRALADSLTSKPDAVVIIDMIGDTNLNVYQEKNSDPGLTGQIWRTAAALGYGQEIIPQVKYSMEDDHTPFLEKGIRAVDMIDFDYPYWHTTSDTVDKVSPQSLKIIGDTLLNWLLTMQK